MSFATWLGFLAAAMVIAVTPGPGALASMSAGAGRGYRSALALILGLQAALLCQLAIVAIGLGALLAASEQAFALLRLIGAGYLIWLGIEKWRAAPASDHEQTLAGGHRGLFVQGLLVNLANPKAIVFIAALVPQFVDPTARQLPQYGLIALTLCATDVVVMSCYALAATRLGRWVADRKAASRLNRIFASLFVAFGVLLVVARPSR